MKLRILADKAVFNGRSVEVIELSYKHKPINDSGMIWEVENHFEAGFWSLIRRCYPNRKVELRFRSDGRFRSIEELQGIVYKEGWLSEEFMFSVVEL